MQATLHKKSGGMHHVKKSGGMKLMKKTGGMATTKKTGGMKKIGGMNMTKKSGGNCGMPLATSGGMRRKTVKGGMYHSKKHGGSRKVIGGGENEVIIDGNKYHITVNRGSVTVKAMEPESFEATKVPVLDKDGFPVPPADAADDGGHLDLEDLDTNIEDQSLIIDTLTEQGNKSQEGNELMNIRDPQFQDDEGAKKKEDLSIDKNKSSFGSQEGQKDYTMTDYSKEEKEEEGEGEGDPFTDAPSETLETLINNIKKGDFDKQKIIDGYNNLTTPEDQYGLIEYIENSDLAGKNTILDEIDPRDGLSAMGIYNEASKKKGGKTLKKGSKPVKKHGGSVKKAFNKLFKRGGNKALPKKGGKK
jgi:hypothetical protein